MIYQKVVFWHEYSFVPLVSALQWCYTNQNICHHFNSNCRPFLINASIEPKSCSWWWQWWWESWIPSSELPCNKSPTCHFVHIFQDSPESSLHKTIIKTLWLIGTCFLHSHECNSNRGIWLILVSFLPTVVIVANTFMIISSHTWNCNKASFTQLLLPLLQSWWNVKQCIETIWHSTQNKKPCLMLKH